MPGNKQLEFLVRQWQAVVLSKLFGKYPKYFSTLCNNMILSLKKNFSFFKKFFEVLYLF